MPQCNKHGIPLLPSHKTHKPQKEMPRELPDHAERVDARRLTRKYVRLVIVEACDVCAMCGRKSTVRNPLTKHHTDYTNPLDVDFLCLECHTVEHQTTTQTLRYFARLERQLLTRHSLMGARKCRLCGEASRGRIRQEKGGETWVCIDEAQCANRVRIYGRVKEMEGGCVG